MFHWFTDCFGFFLTERVHAWKGRSTTHGLEDFADPDYPGARLFAQLNGLPYIRGGILEMGGTQLPIAEAQLYRSLLPILSPARPFGTLFKALMRASLFRDRLSGIQMIGEDLPQRTNTVDLDPATKDVFGVPVPRITYTPHAHERTAQLFYIPILTALVKLAGADVAGALPATSTDQFPSPVGDAVPDDKHIMGGMRMGADPATSVCDADGLVRGLDNVGVADASVFVTSGAHNPTLTLMATALRNARRWVGQPGAVAPVAAPPPGSTTTSAPAVIPTTGRAVPIGLAAALGAAGMAGHRIARESADGTDVSAG
jgi:choline dehydrogenase-like flavoprotein